MEYTCLANVSLIDSYRKLNGLNRQYWLSLLGSNQAPSDSESDVQPNKLRDNNF